MKEYTSYKSTAKQLTNTLRKSLFCKSNKQQQQQQLQSMQLPFQKHPHHHLLSSQSSKHKPINVKLDSLVNESNYELPVRNSTNESFVNGNEHLIEKPMSTNDILGTSLHTSQMTSSKKQVSSPTILTNLPDELVQKQEGVTCHQAIK
jgi:hypothetical protein